MSKIDDLIKDLEFKKKKIEFLNIILESSKEYEFVEDDVKTDIIKELEHFITTTANKIENNASSNVSKSVKEPDAPQSKQTEEEPKNQPKTEDQREYSVSEKVSFSLQHRDLNSRRVQVMNDENVDIFGKVVGLDAPNVVVETETGPVIKVPINKIVLK